MQRVVKYTSKKAALRAGVMLSERYNPDQLTGLNFFVEVAGGVILAAVFEGAKRPPERKRLDVVLFPGEPMEAKVEDLIADLGRFEYTFLGDGLEPFRGYCMSMGVRV